MTAAELGADGLVPRGGEAPVGSGGSRPTASSPSRRAELECLVGELLRDRSASADGPGVRGNVRGGVHRRRPARPRRHFVNSIAIRTGPAASWNPGRDPNRTGRTRPGEPTLISSGSATAGCRRFPDVTGPLRGVRGRAGRLRAREHPVPSVGDDGPMFEINPRFSGTTSLRAMVGTTSPTCWCGCTCSARRSPCASRTGPGESTADWPSRSSPPRPRRLRPPRSRHRKPARR